MALVEALIIARWRVVGCLVVRHHDLGCRLGSDERAGMDDIEVDIGQLLAGRCRFGLAD